MEATELSKKVSEKITDLYKYIHTVESCDALIDKIKDMKIVFQSESEDGKIDVVDVSNVLSANQMENAKGIMIAMLNGNKEDANKVLKQFLEFAPVESKKKFADGTDEKTTQTSKVDVDELQKMLKEGITQKEIAEKFGVTKNVIASLVRRLRKKEGETDEK